jgi:hypothetical protein
MSRENVEVVIGQIEKHEPRDFKAVLRPEG